MSEINIAVTIAGSREEQTTTIGTKAWELFKDQPEIIAARVSGAGWQTAMTWVSGPRWRMNSTR